MRFITSPPNTCFFACPESTPIGNFEDEEKWPEIQNDLVDRLFRLENTIMPYFSYKKEPFVNQGIIDYEKNPFIRKSWIEQGLALTPLRQEQLQELFDKSVENILMIKLENKGNYVAIIAIRWGFADILEGRLTPTDNWTKRGSFDGYGQPKY